MPRNPFRTVFFLALVSMSALLALAARATSPAATAQGDKVSELVAKLRDQTDKADPRLVQELADQKTRPAMEALVELYDIMGSPYMRREIVRALATFDGVADAEQPALQKVTDIATGGKEPELRAAALEALGRAVHHGKDFLRMIAVSQGPDELREKAMELHVPLSDEGDHGWYRDVYKPKPADEKAEKEREKQRKLAKGKKKDPKEKDAKDKDAKEEDDAPKLGRSLQKLRWIAFEALEGVLTPDEFVEATKDDYWRIRASALLFLEKRSDKRTVELATKAFENGQEKPSNRIVGAQILARLAGPKAAPDFIKRALKNEAAVELSRGLADVLVAFKDPATDKQLVDDLGKGRTDDKLFSLYAVRKLSDDKIDKTLIKMLSDKEVPVVVETCRTLGVRKSKEALPALSKLVEKGKDRLVIRAAIESMAEIRVGEPGWEEELVALAKHEDVEIRNMAINALGQADAKTRMPALIAALNDMNWSTRYAALRALERMQSTLTIRPMIDRLPKEEGRMKHEIVDALFRLTGQGFEENATGWDKWWKENEQGFVILTPEQLEKARRAEEDYRLKQTTTVASSRYDRTRPESKFFGIKIVSHRVIFIIDVSGSMEEVMHQPYDGKEDVKRIEVAKTELAKSVLSLDSDAFFNIVTFSSAVQHWPEGGLAAANQKNQTDAKAYVEGLLAFGGTNLYGAIEEAFKDKDVDTILIMSDGEPSVGEVIEPMAIREVVKQWNEHRGIVINTISVGGEFQILEWLAEDSGGINVKFE